MNRRIAALVLAALLPAAVVLADGYTGGVQVLIKNATFPKVRKEKEPDRTNRPDLLFELEADNGVWTRGLGSGLNIGDHFGWVQEASIGAERVQIKLAADIANDDYIDGGDGYYTLDMKRSADGRLDGTWEGTYRGEKCSGQVTGQRKPPRPIRIKNFVPLEPDEHPRLMFRKHELPALREKLKTPLGQAYLNKARAATADPVSNAMLYQLTGDKQYAEAARKIIAGYDDLAPEGTGTGDVGHRFVAVAHTLDLCWDAWPESFRKELTVRMINDLIVIQRKLQIAGANFNPCSNFYGPARGCAAIATLVFYGEKGPEPKKPVVPDEMTAKGDLESLLRVESGETDKYKAEYPKLVARWQVEFNEWKASGGADLAKMVLFYKGYLHMLRTYRVGIGEGGFAAETGVYSAIAPRYPLFYATYYLRCFGRNASAAPDITHHLSRRLMQCVFPTNEPPAAGDKGLREREPVCLKINSIAGFTYGGLEWVAGAFPLIPDEHKPSMLWAWNYIRNVREEQPASVANIIPEVGEYGVYPAHAFVNYPLDLKPRHPRDGMPLHWEAKTMGLYLFRNGWVDQNDIVAQFWGKCHPIGGWNHPNAGTFNLLALGHVWATCNPERLGYREQENVVLLPDDQIRGGQSGYVSHYQTRADGSGTVTFDLRDLYGGAKTVPRPAVAPKVVAGRVTVRDLKAEEDRVLPVRDMLNNRLPENWADSGISGLRAFGVDYSGKSGAPCLMVIVDKIEGAKKRVWTWQLNRDSAKTKNESFKEVKILPDGFVLDHGDATLRATFVTPRKLLIERKTEDVVLGRKPGGGRWFEGFIDRIQATSENESFFVVLTVQRKDAPAVAVEGEGLTARVKIGNQTVRFDGDKVVLGP